MRPKFLKDMEEKDRVSQAGSVHHAMPLKCPMDQISVANDAVRMDRPSWTNWLHRQYSECVLRLKANAVAVRMRNFKRYCKREIAVEEGRNEGEATPVAASLGEPQAMACHLLTV